MPPESHPETGAPALPVRRTGRGSFSETWHREPDCQVAAEEDQERALLGGARQPRARRRALDGVAVSPAPESSTPDAGVSAGRTDDGFPGVGEPGVGAPGVIKNTDTNTEKNTSSSFSSSSTSESADDHGQKEEEEKEATSSPIGEPAAT